jgi:hypothetical protein
MTDADELVVEPEVGEEDDGPCQGRDPLDSNQLLLPALPARLLQKLLVLLLSHLLAALLDERGQASSFPVVRTRAQRV